MKKKLLYLFVLVGAILVAGGRKAQAQLDEGVDATIPFQFHAGGTEFPAGKYYIRSVSTADDSLMEIRSVDGRKAGLFETEQGDTTATMKNNELIFNQVGDTYYLSEIVDADDAVGAEVFSADETGKQAAAQPITGRKHILAFLHL